MPFDLLFYLFFLYLCEILISDIQRHSNLAIEIAVNGIQFKDAITSCFSGPRVLHAPFSMNGIQTHSKIFSWVR